jgi:hypothetical protein
VILSSKNHQFRSYTRGWCSSRACGSTTHDRTGTLSSGGAARTHDDEKVPENGESREMFGGHLYSQRTLRTHRLLSGPRGYYWSLSALFFLHTPHFPPSLAQCLQYLQFLQAWQGSAPVQVAAEVPDGIWPMRRIDSKT